VFVSFGGWARLGFTELPDDGLSRFVKRTSVPPVGKRVTDRSSADARMNSRPRPFGLRRFSGASGSRTSSRSKPWPWSRTVVTSRLGTQREASVNSIDTRRVLDSRLPWTIALVTASQTATPRSWASRSAIP